MSTFALDVNSNPADIITGLNYAISNLGQGGTGTSTNVLTSNVTTGEITTTITNTAGYSTTTVVSYLYQYMDVKYANTATGSSGFTSNCRQAQYFGLRNTANANPISSNPAEYIWYQVTGGFGLTKNLWYQTIGGRQIAFFAGNAAPLPNYIPVPDMPTANSAPINLDSITSVQNNQIINVSAYYQANATPATPSGGTYNFSTFTLTPPSGWSSTIPPFVANTTIYISQAAFVGNSVSTVGPSTLWTTPVAYIEQFQGNTGAQGQRGFVPMGYVICSTDPATFSNPTDYSNAFAAARTNASPPIGLGFSPITNDTAQFFYANLFTGTNTTTVRQFNGNIWINVDAQVISGGLFVPGTITANTLNANQVYAVTVASTNATVGDFGSPGYWLQANTGNARFGGNINVGNSLKVGVDAQIGANLNIGTNAVIGNNLTVANNASIGDSLAVANNATIGNNLQVGTNATIGGVIVGGVLAPYTVGNIQIQPNSLNASTSIIDGSIGSTQIGSNAIITGKIATDAITANTIQANAITAGKIAADAVTTNTIAANAITTGKIAANSITGNTIQANTIQGSSIVAGSITSNELSANIVIAGNIISFGQTVENPTGVGYWLDYTNGNVYFGGNTVVGNNLKVGANAQIGNNLQVGTNATIGGVIIGGVIAAGQIGNVQLQTNLNGGLLASNSVLGSSIISLNGSRIDSASITTTQIGSNAIATNQLQANSIVAGKIAADAVTANVIAAGSVVAGKIGVGAITANTISSGAITAGAISANAITAGTIAAGAISSYSLQASSVTAGAIAAGAITASAIAANAITAGTVAANAITSYSLAANAVVAGTIAANAISAYSMQANSVTGNAINANTITTTNLVFNSATGSASLGPTYPGTYPIAFYNNGVTNPTAAGYLWPANTRGYAQDHGLSYIPITTGNTQINTRLVVVYSGYVFSANTANLVELWKSGSSAYYLDTYYNIKTLPPIGTALSSDVYYSSGSNGYVAYNYNSGLSGSWNTARSPSDSFYTWNNSQPLETLVGYYNYASPSLYPTVTMWSTKGVEITTQSNTATIYSGGPNNVVANVGTQYGSVQSKGLSNTGTPLYISVGQYGATYQIGGAGVRFPDSTGVTATLYSIDLSTGPTSTTTTGVVAVAVGSNGTIVRNVYAQGGGQANGSGWVQKSSGTINNLNGVRCNWATLSGTGTAWCAVGDNGTILTSPDGNTWTAQTSGTDQNLYGISYGNGYWVAVGANTIICYSLDGISWTVIQGPQGNDSAYRTLYSVTYGANSNSFVAGGQSIMMRASGSTPGTWATQYDGGASVQSINTRLAAWGSDGSNIANVTVPGLNQQLGSQVVSGQYVDYNYTAGATQTYYLVMGNLTGNAVQTNSATLQVTEFKR